MSSNKISSWDTLQRLQPNNISIEATLWSCILKTLQLRQFIFFRATLRSCIPTLPFEAILQNCILKTFHLRQLCGVVFPHFPFGQVYEVVFSQHFLLKAILRNCILKTFPLRQFCGIVFSKYFLLRQFY